MAQKNREKTVVFLCGLIGSGKTTYAVRHYKHFTDLDYLPEYSRKIDQIRWTKRLLEKYDEVCHITCFPTPEELKAFQGFRKKYLLLETGFEKSKANILIRNRERDMQNLIDVLDANIHLLDQYKQSNMEWKKVKVFA